MHDYSPLDSRVLVHVSVAFFLLLISRFVHLQVLVGFACIGGGVASEVVADGVEMMTM